MNQPCPSCVLEFLVNHSVNELGSEIEDGRENGWKLCAEHTDNNIFIECHELNQLIGLS